MSISPKKNRKTFTEKSVCQLSNSIQRRQKRETDKTKENQRTILHRNILHQHEVSETCKILYFPSKLIEKLCAFFK